MFKKGPNTPPSSEHLEILTFPLRCLVEQDPIARKHAAKLKRFSGTYDRYGNRRPPPTIVTTDENGGILRRGGREDHGNLALTPPRRRRKSYKGCSFVLSNQPQSNFFDHEFMKGFVNFAPATSDGWKRDSRNLYRTKGTYRTRHNNLNLRVKMSSFDLNQPKYPTTTRRKSWRLPDEVKAGHLDQRASD